VPDSALGGVELPEYTRQSLSEPPSRDELTLLDTKHTQPSWNRRAQSRLHRAADILRRVRRNVDLSYRLDDPVQRE
jgi:hypothetical protein